MANIKTKTTRPPNLLARMRKFIASVNYRGNSRYCPLCGQGSSRFIPFGIPARADARCFHCDSLERHRFLWAYLQRNTDFFSRPPAVFLHFAPESCLEQRFHTVVGDGYITADIEPEKAMVQVDVTKISYSDAYFDAILCSHVLEHVPDDAQAIRELYRVVKPDGWALLMVPTREGTTLEDPAVIDPKLRLELFGQEDHVRIYGSDFPVRLQSAGFHVECITPEKIFSQDEMLRFGIPLLGGDIYRVSKT